MAERLGLALVGAGMAAKPHAAALKEVSDRIDVRGVFARRPEARAAFASEHGFPEVESLEALVADPSVEAALIITPPNARTDIVGAFAAAGKHVLSEKPLERTEPAARTIVETCERAGVTLGVMFQHRFRAASMALAEGLAEGRFGVIRIVGIEVPWWRDQAYYDEPGRGSYARDGGGVLISQAIHTIDLMLSLTGPVAEVQGLTATTPFHRMESEDYAAATLRFASGAVGHLMASTAHFPGEAESIRLECDRAALRLKSGVLDIHWRDGRHEQVGETATTGGGADPMAFPSDWHRDLILDFAEAVQTGRAPRVTGRDALEVQRLIAAIERSASELRTIQVSQE